MSKWHKNLKTALNYLILIVRALDVFMNIGIGGGI